MEKLRAYLNSLTTEAQTAFALACDTSVGYLRKQISSGGLLNPETCVAAERESAGSVTRKDLRPDDWQKIWPELEAVTE
jgi:DNA-binding transcriptional regulator YdaS (Cro superfamily)